jgi:hypothetical protein
MSLTSYSQQQMLTFPAAGRRLVVEQLTILRCEEYVEEIFAEQGPHRAARAETVNRRLQRTTASCTANA